MLLYPQKAGDIEIDPMTLDVTIDVPTNRRDFFGNVIYSQTSNKVSSEKVKIITNLFLKKISQKNLMVPSEILKYLQNQIKVSYHQTNHFKLN